MLKQFLLAGSALMAVSACTTAPSGEPVAAADVVPAAAEPVAAAATAVPDNVLLADWTGSFDGVPPWDKVKPSDFPEAFQFAIDEQRREYQAITNNPEAPTFANTIEAM